MPAARPAEAVANPLTPSSPVLVQLERWQWLLPIVSFAVGWVGYVAIERGPGLARAVAITALLSWFWLLFEQLAGRWLHRLSKGRLSENLACFVTQSLQQELLFFSLPFAIGAAQLDIWHGLFLLILGAAALVSTIDPVYQKRIASSPTMAVCFQVYCSWVAALVVLPIALHLPLEHSAPLAAIIALIALAAGLPRMLAPVSGVWRCLVRAGPAALALVVVTQLSALLPAISLRQTESRITTQITQLKPGPAIDRIDIATLGQTGLVAYTAIHAPAGLKQELTFDWYHGRQLVDRIPAEIEGVGEKARSWRTWTRKQNFTEDPRGNWRVDIRTAGGQLVGRLRFRVT